MTDLDLDTLERQIATVPIQHHFRDYIFHEVMPALIQRLRKAEATIEQLNVEGKASIRKLVAMVEDIETVQDALLVQANARIVQLEAEVGVQHRGWVEAEEAQHRLHKANVHLERVREAASTYEEAAEQYMDFSEIGRRVTIPRDRYDAASNAYRDFRRQLDDALVDSEGITPNLKGEELR